MVLVPFWVGSPPILVYFIGDWDVHWGYRLLTHGQLPFVSPSSCLLAKKFTFSADQPGLTGPERLAPRRKLREARTVEANGAREALSAEAEASGGTKARASERAAWAHVLLPSVCCFFDGTKQPTHPKKY